MPTARREPERPGDPEADRKLFGRFDALIQLFTSDLLTGGSAGALAMTKLGSLATEAIWVYSIDSAYPKHFSLVLYSDFSPGRWGNCNVTASSMAEYFGELFPEIGIETGTHLINRSEKTGSIGFVLNELVENAVK